MPSDIFTKTIYNPYTNPGQKVRQPTPEEYRNMKKYLENVHKKE